MAPEGNNELTGSWPFRLFAIVAALGWWLAAIGHTQESGIGCSATVIDRGCEMAPKSSVDGTEPRVPPAPSRPIVTYANGKLTVTASNTSLAGVLRAISAQTGTVIEFPAGSAADRIVVHEGPDTIRHVLVNLLNGSDFNYVILASPNTPDELERVVLAKAGQPAQASPQPADETTSTSDQPKNSSSLFWTPPSGSLFWTPPKDDPSAAVLPKAVDSGSVEPPKDPIPADVLEQMMKDRARQIREQVQQPQ